MLRTSEEIALLASAQEPGIRDPKRSEYGIDNIFKDFLAGLDFRNRHVLELGPGHYEFCEAIRARGGIAEAVELDPPVGELGRRKGFKVHMGNLVQLPELGLHGGYDGLFCKGSNNPFWFKDDEAGLRRYIQCILGLLKHNGWAWIVSCPYTSPTLGPEQMLSWLETEQKIYAEHGCREMTLPGRVKAGFYGISYVPPRLSIYTRNLPEPTLTGLASLRFGKYLVRTAVRKVVVRLIG